jgi:hypothetical protein
VAELDKAIVKPAQTLEGPEIAEGAPLTVITSVAGEPQPLLYEINDVPIDIAFTRPELLPTVITLVLLLVHEPPDAVLEREVELPLQIDDEPEIDDGVALTVIVILAALPHPVE